MCFNWFCHDLPCRSCHQRNVFLQNVHLQQDQVQKSYPIQWGIYRMIFDPLSKMSNHNRETSPVVPSPWWHDTCFSKNNKSEWSLSCLDGCPQDQEFRIQFFPVYWEILSDSCLVPCLSKTHVALRPIGLTLIMPRRNSTKVPLTEPVQILSSNYKGEPTV